MKSSRAEPRFAYPALGAACLVVSLLAGWTAYAHRIDNIFQDLYFRQRGAEKLDPRIAVVAIDDATLARFGGLPLNRSRVAEVVRAIKAARPRAICIDLLLTDESSPGADRDLADALAPVAGETPVPVILAVAMDAARGERWLLPRPEFARAAAAVAHVHADPDEDGVSRQVLLARSVGRQRYWALALECLRLASADAQHPATPVTESDDALLLNETRGPAVIPTTRKSGRRLLINYAGGNDTFPSTSFAALLDSPRAADNLRDKIVLLGVTAQGTGDRLFTPFSSGAGMAGVEIHANILNTLLTGRYLQPAGDLAVVLVLVAIVALTLAALRKLHGPAQWAALGAVAAAVVVAPYALFLARQVWPGFGMLLTFAIALAAGEAYQLLVLRNRYEESEKRRRRSQQQFEMAAHEIRTPLAAIQASSELLSRYSLDDSRRRQMMQLLNDESKRLARLVERFLAVERLSAGEMELRLAPLNLHAALCELVERLRPVAERKEIRLTYKNRAGEIRIDADAELLEFAVSNLLNNAVKYSPRGSSVVLVCESDEDTVRIHVADNGGGMTPEQTRRIFDRFYRTESAEQSQAPGFGLGLAIAREIAVHHGGDVAVESAPGAGSRFTIALPLRNALNAAPQVRSAGRNSVPL